VVSPLSATAPLFVLAIALLFPSSTRKIGWRIAVGTVLIVLGVILLTGPPITAPG
jgi:drug/metabolite transporter (DMT)-like permease